MKAVQLSHDRHKIRAAVLEFTKEKRLEIPGRLKDKFNGRAHRETLAEKQQEERTGISKAERRRDITQAWNKSDSGQSFLAALKDKGYTLAQGDRRGYVLIDRHGEIHSLARQIEGVKTKQITERLRDFPADKLPTAAKAREQARAAAPALSLKDFFKLKADNQRAALIQQHRGRRAKLEARQKALQERQNAERTALLALHRDRNKAIADQRRDREPTGLAKWLGKVTGIDKLRKARQKEADAQRRQAQRENIGQLTRRQERERRDLARHFRALGRVEKRELRSIETKIRREILTQQRAQQRTPERTQERAPQSEKQKQFRENALELTAPATPPAAPAGRSESSVITDKFAEALKARAEQKKKQSDRQKNHTRDRGPRPD